jgi:Subunit ChlI of Mg-chelatase
VRSALIASGLALPASRITVNLAPADLPKEESHYDLPIAFGLMAAIGPSCGMASRPSSPRTVKLLSDLFALAASFRINVRSRRWWSARATRRDLTGAQRCPLPRRAAGILAPGPRFIAAAARNRRSGSLACLSRPLHADRGDEPVPLRARERPRVHLQAWSEHALCPGAHGRLSGPLVDRIDLQP